MKSTDILAFSVFTAVLMLGAVSLVDATEAGLVVSDVEAPVIGGVFATLAAASIGVVVGNRLLGTHRKKGGDDEQRPQGPGTHPSDQTSPQEAGEE